MIRLAVDVHESVLSLGPGERRALLAGVAAAGLDHAVVAERMQRLYHLPFERFENVTAAGSASEVAEWLPPYVTAGGRHVTLTATARDWQAGVDQAAAVKERLGQLLG